MVSFNSRVGSNQPHRYQRENVGDRDANAQNAYRQQQEEEESYKEPLPDTKEDLSKPIAFLDKKEKVAIQDLEKATVLDPNLTLNKELKELITSINTKTQDKANSEYLSDLLFDFSKIKDKPKQQEILRLLQSIANRIHTVYFQEVLGKQIVNLLHNNPYFSETILIAFLSLNEKQKYILKRLKYHSIYAPEYSKIIDLHETQSQTIIDYFLNQKELPMISYPLLERLSVIFLSMYSIESETMSNQTLKSLVRLFKHSLESSTTKENLKVYLKLFKEFKQVLKTREPISKSKISRYFSEIFHPSKPINLVNTSIKKIRAFLKGL